MVILVDDEDRENEGDLTMAAEHVTPEAINFMAKYGRGLICLPMAPELVDRLQLPLMTQRNGSRFGTNFTVSIEAREGITTGISAADRATTIKAAVADEVRPEDLVTPGHVFPLKAKAGGVLSRAGQTEGGVDLVRLAGLKPAAVICEIMRDDGTMARMPDLEAFAVEHDLKIAAVKDLIRYRLSRGQVSVRCDAHAHLPTMFGDFTVYAYESDTEPGTHLAMVKGDIGGPEPVLTRVHSQCLTGDALALCAATAAGSSARPCARSSRKAGACCSICGRKGAASGWPIKSGPMPFRIKAMIRWRPTASWAFPTICAITARARKSWWIWGFAKSAC